MEVTLKKFGTSIVTPDRGKEVYDYLKRCYDEDGNLIIDLADTVSMTTYCARQIFGEFYTELGPAHFYKTIKLKNLSDELGLVIKMGIRKAIKAKELA